MKKILLFTSILFFAFSLSTVKAQSLDSVITTTPIVCYGDFATVTAYMTQTIPGTPIQLVNYRFAGSNLFSFGSSGVTTGAAQPFGSMISNCYRMFMVDSASFATNVLSLPFLALQNELDNPTDPSIIGYVDYCVDGVPELLVTATQTADNLCNGDCDASEKLDILGGTPPYSITINGTTSVLGLGSIDTTYSNLCAGTINATIVDVNGCVSNPGVTSFTISEPTLLIPDGSINSNYNGQDISCFGANDGEILASASGGTPVYTYSIDGVNFVTNPLFGGLIAGSYTITYRDENGCDTTENFILSDPQNLSGALTINQQVSCNGIADGEIEFIVNNVNTGTPGYQFSIDGGATFQSSSVFTGLSGGNPAIQYTIQVKDVNNCLFSASIFLSEPIEISFSASSSDFNGFGVSCDGETDGQIIIFSPSGGTPSYEYSITGGAPYSSTMIYSAPANPIGAGTYQVIVRDASGCQNDTTIVITSPNPFSITATETSIISCVDVCDGEITVTSTNGVGLITYNTLPFTSSQTTNVWDSLCAGSYTIIAEDENLCIANDIIILTDPLPWVYTVDSTQETCGLANGQASINVTQGGTGPGTYAYLWDDPAPQQISATATGLVTGLYEIRVTDLNGCTFTEDIFIGEADITLVFDSIAPCNALDDGSVTVTASGLPPYLYQWGQGSTPPSNPIAGANSLNLTGLSAGSYWVLVTDATGCQVTGIVSLPSSALVDITLDVASSMLDVTCFGESSSGVTVIATGGVPNTYLYHIPNVAGSQSSGLFTGLYAGTYPIYATDVNLCSDSVLVTITEPDQLAVMTSSQDVGCNGGDDGIASIDTVYGGTAPYFYLWSTGETTASISNLTVGTYTVQVTDVNGCETDTPITTFIIDESPVLLSAITIISNATCAGSQTLATGEMTATATGGAPGYDYTWIYPDGTTSSSQNIINLINGMYTVTITDQNNCIISDSSEILQGENPSVAVVIQNVSCFGQNDGFMTTSAIGGTPPYQFSSDGGFTFQTSITFGPTGAANYFITVRDTLGCTDTASVNVTEPEILDVSITITQNVNCYDSINGELAATVTGGTPGYSYIWTDIATNIVANTQTATGLLAGSYSVSVTDTNNCPSALSAPKIITQPDSLYISALTHTSVLCNGDSTGTATVVAAGGTPGYSYTWSSGSLSDLATNLTAGTYSVQISDINGCSRNESIIVTEPNILSATYNGEPVSCIDGNDGWAKVLVGGGVGPFGYLWETGSTVDSIGNLSEDWYTVTIIDANLCILIDSVSILDPLQPFKIDSLIISEITCHDANNAAITILATGGNIPYMYSSNNGQNQQSNIGFSNLGPGIYVMYVEDSKGCLDRDTVTFVNPPLLYIDSTTFSHVSCNGLNDGAIQAISAFGGTPPYEYSVNGGQHHANMAYFNGYPVGTYTVEVWDANDCGAQDIIIITEPNELDVTITTSASNWAPYMIQCHGDSSGTAIIALNGGIGPYINTVLDINGDTIVSSTNSNISGLTAGTYTFVVMDANGCLYSETITYNEPDLIVHNFIATHVSCSGWNNGSLTDMVSGGVGMATTYGYTWFPGGSNTYSLTSIPIGTYVMTVVDEIGCISIDSFVINDDNALNLTVTGYEDVSCYDYCDGFIVTNTTGGMPNYNSNGVPIYSYQWDDILLQNTANSIGLCVDNNLDSTTYTCIVSDQQNCTDTISYTLYQPDSLSVTASILSDISCNLGNSGILTATVTGGNGGTTYLWNNGINFTSNPVNNNLSAGSYVVVAMDINDCIDTTEIYLTEPSALSIVISNEIDISCFGFDDGTITATAVGGTPISGIPPKYEYDWSNGLVETVTVSTATGLNPNIYTVTATDANGCEITAQSVYITEPGNPLSIAVDSTDEVCNNDGAATAFVVGGTQPYNYVWNNGGVTNPLMNLAPGLLYTVNVTDANGCTISGETFVNGSHNIFLPGNLSFIDSTVCLGTSVSFPIQVKPLFFYVWMYNNDTIYSANSLEYVDITVTPTEPENVYTLYITDPACTNPYAVIATIYVPNPVNPLISSDPLPLMIVKNDSISYLEAQIELGTSIDVFSNNINCDIYEWSWMNEKTNELVQLPTQRLINDEPDATGWYYIAVDSAGCLGFDSVRVVVGVVTYDAITPNGDGSNETWNIPGIEYYPDALVQVFSRWGALVHQTSGGGNYIEWNGTSNGEELPVGTYYYIIDLNNGNEPQTGPITLIR